MKVLFFIFIGLTVIYAKTIKFLDCGSLNGKILEVDLSPCDVEPCELVRGKNVTMAIIFQTTMTTQTATVGAAVKIENGVYPLKVANPNGCHTLPCPLVPGQEYTTNGSFVVPSNVPSVPFAFDFQATLTGDDQAKILCGQIKLKLK